MSVSVPSGLAALSLVLMGSLASLGCQRMLCGEPTLLREIASPDGRTHLGVFDRNCGATTGSMMVVMVRDGKTYEDARETEILVVHGLPNVSLTWEFGRLVVALTAEAESSVIERRTRARGVDVGFVTIPGTTKANGDGAGPRRR
jgi:hypothetical protein